MTVFKYLCGLVYGAFLTSAFAVPALSQAELIVTSPADSGDGSLRAALATASAAPGPSTIVVRAKVPIVLDSGLTYSGRAPLAIYGNGTGIVTETAETLLTISEGADLYIHNLSLAGSGDFSIEARGDIDGPAGKGIFVDVRDDQTGTVRLELEDVRVAGVAGHGIHVSDCRTADNCSDGQGSDASIDVRLISVEVADVGHGRFDADGVRVDERGAGDIRFNASASRFARVGADGVQLDEGQAGDAIVRVSASAFEMNGDYCNPIRLSAFLPDEVEGEFDRGARASDTIPAPVRGSLDDRCFERDVNLHDDGSVGAYDFTVAAEDGFDVHEAGPGGITAVVERTGTVRNLDQGLDFDEDGPGSIDLTLIGTTGRGNTDDAYKVSESGPGDVTVLIVDAVADGNGGVGAIFEEADDGNLSVHARGLRTQFNDGNETGLQVAQTGSGTGRLVLLDAQIDDGIEAEGVEVRD